MFGQIFVLFVALLVRQLSIGSVIFDCCEDPNPKILFHSVRAFNHLKTSDSIFRRSKTGFFL